MEVAWFSEARREFHASLLASILLKTRMAFQAMQIKEVGRV